MLFAKPAVHAKRKADQSVRKDRMLFLFLSAPSVPPIGGGRGRDPPLPSSHSEGGGLPTYCSPSLRLGGFATRRGGGGAFPRASIAPGP